jgi:hypothetical protein
VIVGSILLLVPANLSAFGARSRLESSANTLASAFGGARDQSILDGYEVRVELGTWRDADGTHQGYRWVFTNVPPPSAGSLNQDTERQRQVKAERGQERQWITTTWHPLEGGVTIVGVSEEAGRWNKLPAHEPYRIKYRPDGGVEKAFAVRLESSDIGSSRKEDKTITVVVNGLTSEASVEDGEVELPRKREFREFR